MNNEKPYSHPRWYSPLSGETVGKANIEITEEEKKQDEEFVRKFKEAI